MKNRIISNTVDAKSGRIDDACARYGVGRTTMRQLAADAGAVVRVGKCWLVNYSVMDKYMDTMAGEE